MKGDFTRITFDQANQFTRVLMQQGRVQMDADWNEQVAILLHYLQSLAVDLGGPYWGPSDGAGFEISSEAEDGGNFTIGPGRYYVDGLLVENEQPLRFLEQKGFYDLDLPEMGKSYYVYLDVWERHVTYVQVDHIRDAALGVGGPDTCSRAQLVGQVKLAEIQNVDQATCEDVENWTNGQPKLSEAWLKARLQEVRPDNNACAVPPDALYRGTENQLYRIEVHRPGVAWNGIMDGGVPAGNAIDAATFKWSHANGADVWAIKQQQGSVATVQSLGRDTRTALNVGDWVEILDDTLELRGEPGILAQVQEVDAFTMRVTLKQPDDVDLDDPRFRWPTYEEGDPKHPLLRRWDHHTGEGAAMSEGALLITEKEGLWIPIEHGIEIQFQPAPPDQPRTGENHYRTADYWGFEVRVGMQRLDLPVVRQADGSEGPEALPPHGVTHHYAPLGVIANRAVRSTCRCTLRSEIVDCDNRRDRG